MLEPEEGRGGVSSSVSKKWKRPIAGRVWGSRGVLAIEAEELALTLEAVCGDCGTGGCHPKVLPAAGAARMRGMGIGGSRMDMPGVHQAGAGN